MADDLHSNLHLRCELANQIQEIRTDDGIEVKRHTLVSKQVGGGGGGGKDDDLHAEIDVSQLFAVAFLKVHVETRR